jgi:hypothetical protein
VTDLRYSDGIAAACTMIVLEANPSRAAPAASNRLAARPLLGDDLRGTSLRGANLLVPFHEMYAVRSQDNHLSGLQHVSYVPFVSHARERATGELAHRHWFTYMEDHAGVPGKYGDATLAHITRDEMRDQLTASTQPFRRASGMPCRPKWLLPTTTARSACSSTASSPATHTAWTSTRTSRNAN